MAKATRAFKKLVSGKVTLSKKSACLLEDGTERCEVGEGFSEEDLKSIFSRKVSDSDLQALENQGNSLSRHKRTITSVGDFILSVFAFLVIVGCIASFVALLGLFAMAG